LSLAETLKIGDAVVVGLPLGQAIGRIGCLLAGCCWGVPSYHLDASGGFVADGPFAISFPSESPAYHAIVQNPPLGDVVLGRMMSTEATMPLVPFQLIDALGLALIFSLLLVVRAKHKKAGMVLAAWALSYSVLRLFDESLRGDTERGMVTP